MNSTWEVSESEWSKRRILVFAVFTPPKLPLLTVHSSLSIFISQQPWYLLITAHSFHLFFFFYLPLYWTGATSHLGTLSGCNSPITPSPGCIQQAMAYWHGGRINQFSCTNSVVPVTFQGLPCVKLEPISIKESIPA